MVEDINRGLCVSIRNEPSCYSCSWSSYSIWIFGHKIVEITTKKHTNALTNWNLPLQNARSILANESTLNLKPLGPANWEFS